MSNRLAVLFLFAVSILGLTWLSGCGSNSPTAPVGEAATPGAKPDTTGYNPHDVPISDEQKQHLRVDATAFPKAVAVIQELRNATAEETKNGIPENPHEAHQALDKADLVFQWLPEIARDSGVPKEHWEEVTTTANDLRTLFEKVHQNIDNKQEPDFASVAGEIDQKIARLLEIAQAPSSAKSEAQP